MLDAGCGEKQSVGGRIGQKEIRAVAETGLNAVLQEPMDNVDGRTQQVCLRTDGLAHGLASMQDHLEVEAGNDRAGRADVIACVSRLLTPCTKRLVHPLEAREDGIAPAVQ